MARQPEFEEAPAFCPKIPSPCGSIFTIINYDKDYNILRVEVEIGKGGTCGRTMHTTVGNLMTIAVNDGKVPVKDIIDIMKGMQCGNTPHGKQSCTEAVVKAIRMFNKFVKEQKEKEKEK